MGFERNKVSAAVIQAAIIFVVASILFFRFNRVIGASIAAGVGLFVLTTGLFAPRAFLAFERFWLAVGRVVGVVLTWVMLAPFFYVFFTAARVLLLLRGKDPMNRRCPSDEKTYWIERDPDPEGTRHTYGKQY